MARKTETAGLAPRQDGPAPRRTRWSHRTRWFRALIALAVCGTAVGGVAAYRSLSGGSGERPVTMDEASRLALSRLNVYQASPVAVTLTAAEGGGVVLRVSGVVDYRTHHGVGSYQTTGAGFTGSSGTSGATAAPQLDQGLIVWDSDGLGLAPALDGTPTLAAGRAHPPLGLVAALLHHRSAGRRATTADRARRGPARQPAAARPVRRPLAGPRPDRRPRLRRDLRPSGHRHHPGQRPRRWEVAADLLGGRQRRPAQGHHANAGPGHPDHPGVHRARRQRQAPGGALGHGHRLRPESHGAPRIRLRVSARPAPHRSPWAAGTRPDRRSPATRSPERPRPSGRASTAARAAPAPG